jgi:hypothetical protein
MGVSAAPGSDTRAAAVCAALALALVASASMAARAQVQPTPAACERLGALEVAWLAFETQDVNAPLRRVYDDVRAVSAALEQFEAEARTLNPAAFDQLKQALGAVQAAIDALADHTAPAEVQAAIASAKDNARFAYQTLTVNLDCP